MMKATISRILANVTKEIANIRNNGSEPKLLLDQELSDLNRRTDSIRRDIDEGIVTNPGFHQKELEEFKKRITDLLLRVDAIAKRFGGSQ